MTDINSEVITANLHTFKFAKICYAKFNPTHSTAAPYTTIGGREGLSTQFQLS